MHLCTYYLSKSWDCLKTHAHHRSIGFSKLGVLPLRLYLRLHPLFYDAPNSYQPHASLMKDLCSSHGISLEGPPVSIRQPAIEISLGWF